MFVLFRRNNGYISMPYVVYHFLMLVFSLIGVSTTIMMVAEALFISLGYSIGKGICYTIVLGNCGRIFWTQNYITNFWKTYTSRSLTQRNTVATRFLDYHRSSKNVIPGHSSGFLGNHGKKTSEIFLKFWKSYVNIRPLEKVPVILYTIGCLLSKDQELQLNLAKWFSLAFRHVFRFEVFLTNICRLLHSSSWHAIIFFWQWKNIQSFLMATVLVGIIMEGVNCPLSPSFLFFMSLVG